MPSTPPTLAALLLVASTASATITIPTVKVGDAGNHPDPSTGGEYGDVAYDYQIGTYEVTNRQYTEFLNAVARTDTHGLWNARMGLSSHHSGITRSGTNGSYNYTVKSGFENKPVHQASFWSATRFANWLTNGQPTGMQDKDTTEDGMYNLGSITNPENNNVTRELNFNLGQNGVAIASEDEWYKAAYYNPTLNNNSGGYYVYPTRSNTKPTAEDPPGGANSANFDPKVGPGTVTNVGAYVDSASFYGTFDQGGNVFEWNDAIISDAYRGMRGGSFGSGSVLNSSARDMLKPTDASPGFRVTSLTAIPEPSSYGAIFGVVGLAAAVFFRRRRRRE